MDRVAYIITGKPRQKNIKGSSFSPNPKCVLTSKVNLFQHSKVSPGLDPAAILASVMMMNLVFVAIKYEIHDYFHEILEIAP